MKILMYSIYAFDKPFIENATHGKLEFEYTNQPLNEDTVKLAEGFEGPFSPLIMPLIPYWKNYIYVVSDILPYALYLIMSI
jgi:D-lactate dehydrogenase